VSGRELKSELFGKPFRATYEYAIRRITDLLDQRGHVEPPQRIYAVGDNPLSGTSLPLPLDVRLLMMKMMKVLMGMVVMMVVDIKGANGMGWTSILVRTGCFQSEADNDAQHPATHVCPSITEAVEYILQREGLAEPPTTSSSS
jgi:ribonucleotide monophosphatase NagD (HAD superfamily)